MRALLQMLHVTKVGGVQEDAFMAVGTLVEGTNDYLRKKSSYVFIYLIYMIDNNPTGS